MSKKEIIEQILIREKDNIHFVIPYDLSKEKVFIFNLTESNNELKKIDVVNTKELNKYIFSKLAENNAKVGAGGYDEDRFIYKRSSVFTGGEEIRTIHLGIDVWAGAGTPVLSPFNAKVHSFKNNNSFGNYGPTIILEHEIDSVKFYSLYGHLNLECLDNLYEGKQITAGDEIAKFGDMEVNGNWPPHLHFQLMTDMLRNKGDFPGVASKTEREKYLDLCPNPNLILQIPGLG